MTRPDYEVAPAALASAAADIGAVLDLLRALGPVTQEELGPLPGDVGNAVLSTAFLRFCDRWEWAVRDGLRSAEEMADGLRAACATYAQADDVGLELLGRLAFDLVGDPGAAAGGWSDVLDDESDHRMPDWGQIGAEWADTGRDLIDGTGPGLIARALAGDDPATGPLDDLRPVTG